MSLENMKAALYARVSKDENFDDNRFQDVENQLIPLRQFAKAKGYDIFKEYIDKQSGADSNRIEFKQMLKDAALMKFKAVFVWKLDRFSREPMIVVLSYIEQLKNRFIGIVSLTESWLDTTQDNPMTDLVIAIMSWAAAEERRKISERTKAGIVRLRAIGQWKGGRPKKRGVGVTIVNKSS